MWFVQWGIHSCALTTQTVLFGDLNAAATEMEGPLDVTWAYSWHSSGTDKNDNVLNSWYEVAKIRQYSLVGLTNPFRNMFLRSGVYYASDNIVTIISCAVLCCEGSEILAKEWFFLVVI